MLCRGRLLFDDKNAEEAWEDTEGKSDRVLSLLFDDNTIRMPGKIQKENPVWVHRGR